MQDPIYLDYNATTPIAPEVLEVMISALRDDWGNPSSSHAYGLEARRTIDRARGQVAALVGCEDDEIVFTAGGTESDNAAMVGVAEAVEERGKHVVISSVEHAAIGRACDYLARRGWQVSRVPVGPDGRIALPELERALRDDTTLVSVIHAQNETGVLQPLREISGIVRARGIVLHSDTAQSVGKLPVHVDDLGVDLLTIVGHKLYGPKGVGALYVRRGTPFAGFLRGADHEGGRRAGTENVPAIVGLGAACALAHDELPARSAHLRELRDRLEGGLRRQVPDLVVHGADAERLPNTLCTALPRCIASEMLRRTEGVALAAGQACDAGKAEVSGVLQAMRVPEELARCTLRLTVGRPTTIEEIDTAAERIGRAARELRDPVDS